MFRVIPSNLNGFDLVANLSEQNNLCLVLAFEFQFTGGEPNVADVRLSLMVTSPVDNSVAASRPN